MGSQTFDSSDLDSPGYEYLRSYRVMSNLYYKLIALDYQKEFCPLYKCPPINKFYFALQNSNQIEQQFSFTCLCVWLIKDKCQMNFDADPREYHDIDSTVNVIFEALKLLLSSDEHPVDESNLFPVGRLKRGHGPEVIYCLNKFADRALELLIEDRPKIGQVEINYINKQKENREQNRGPTNSITICQPIVGGGLTTRPLGSYQINDSSLIFDYNEADITNDGDETSSKESNTAIGWTQEKLDKIAPLFEVDYDEGAAARRSLQDLLGALGRAHEEAKEFISRSKPALEMISLRIEREMQIITGRETSFHANLKGPIESFLSVWREHSEQSRRNSELTEQINHKTDAFEHYVEQLRDLRARKVKQNDESTLHELEGLTRRLNGETQRMDLKLGLLLAGLCRTGSSGR